jgi:predicted unusual protein kinase regulating ubiquinone biosynthesis (AarF/ABC1/UbiB family)
MCRELQDDKRLAFAKMIYAATSMDFGSLLSSFADMGLKLKRHDPAEDMKNIRFILRDTAPGKEMRTQFKKFREDVWQKRQQLPKSERNPVEAYPAELLFFFRVTLLLRGLCAVLEVRVRYSTLLAPYAKLALIRRFTSAEQAATAVLPKAFPAGAESLEHVQKAVVVKLKQMHRQGLFTV